MGYRTIIAHVDGTDDGARVLSTATRLATRFDAHLAAVYGSDWNLYAASALDPAAGELLRYQVENDEALRARARAQVAAAEAAQGRAIEWRSIPADLDFQLAQHARHADLVVAGQDNPAHRMRLGTGRVASLVLHAGRPVIAVPYSCDSVACGQNVLVAWNGSREAARAVADALPLLSAARRVDVVAFHPPDGAPDRDIPELDVGTWLARHGLPVTVLARTARAGEVGEMLLSLAADLASDLIVMGGYGHSRLGEFVLGGATRTILSCMTVPVLMSH